MTITIILAAVSVLLIAATCCAMVAEENGSSRFAAFVAFVLAITLNVALYYHGTTVTQLCYAKCRSHNGIDDYSDQGVCTCDDGSVYEFQHTFTELRPAR